MSKEEIMLLDMEGCEVRALEIEKETEEASEETLEMLSSELDAIEERKSVIKAEASIFNGTTYTRHSTNIFGYCYCFWIYFVN